MTSALMDSRLFRIDRVEGVRAVRGLLIGITASVAVWVAFIAAIGALFVF